MLWNDGHPTSAALRIAKAVVLALAWFILCVGVIWAAAALWLDASRLRWLAGLIAAFFAGGVAALLILIRPISRALLSVFGLVLLVVIWWSLLPPSNNREWQRDVGRLTRASIHDSKLTIENLRNFDYRTPDDYVERWENKTYNLDNMLGVNLFLCFWGPTLIAHTVASWEFLDGPPLAISIETRKEKGESYSAYRGFYRQYELYYVVADERDVIRLRTNFRGERVYLYKIRMTRDSARALLLDYLKEVNQLANQPRWYNALTNNCTTAIRHHALHVGEGNPWDWRILLNGHIAELGYERGTLDTSLPFEKLKARSEISKVAKSADNAPDFSARIRENLPGRTETQAAR